MAIRMGEIPAHREPLPRASHESARIAPRRALRLQRFDAGQRRCNVECNEPQHAQRALERGLRDIRGNPGQHRQVTVEKTYQVGLLRERGVQTVYLAGLALDFCVAWSALDAMARGFEAIVIEDACRAIDTHGSLDAARRAFADAGVRMIASDALL